mmetsp:Transcript_29221/g.43080  ORF Transcript_29221/g.43080 Transcript_29221/m.43080 type:complete len:100 (+) Transcript_29221:1286-1585(+)
MQFSCTSACYRCRPQIVANITLRLLEYWLKCVWFIWKNTTLMELPKAYTDYMSVNKKNKDPGLAEEFRYLSSIGKGVEKKLKKFKQPVPPSFEAVQKPS